MIPEIRLLAAKASKENDNLWLPLLDHLKDTAGVIEYLASRWLPGAGYDEMEISRKERSEERRGGKEWRSRWSP